MNERTEQIRAVMSDEAFVKSCMEAENEEAVQKLFADKGIEMSLTEIELMAEMISAMADGKLTEAQLEKLANGGELDEDELEAAAGGGPVDLVEGIITRCDALNDEQVAILNATGGSSIGRIIGGIAAGVLAVGAIGYGVYKSKDRISRW